MYSLRDCNRKSVTRVLSKKSLNDQMHTISFRVLFEFPLVASLSTLRFLQIGDCSLFCSQLATTHPFQFRLLKQRLLLNRIVQSHSEH
jgi:hypothetical protein